MFSINLDKLNVNEAELKAFIHQKVDEIQKASEGATIAIKMMSNANNEFTVKIVASHAFGDIHAEGTSDNIYEAIRQAKDVLIQCFNDLSNVSQEDERDLEINEIIQGNKYKH